MGLARTDKPSVSTAEGVVHADKAAVSTYNGVGARSQVHREYCRGCGAC
jgi:Pyruvate/2-oxoacid:ferredoxin oxidoreductase delta subunit